MALAAIGFGHWSSDARGATVPTIQGGELTAPNPSQGSPSVVGCSANGACATFGYSSSGQAPVVHVQSGGVWGAGQQLGSPDGTPAGVDSVACAVAGSCIAVGTTQGTSGGPCNFYQGEGAVYPEDGPSSALVFPGSSTCSTHLSSIACASESRCVAVGAEQTNLDPNDNTDTTTQPLIAVGSTSGLNTPQPVSVPGGDQGRDDQNVLSDVACATSGTCMAIGTYDTGTYGDPDFTSHGLLLINSGGGTYAGEELTDPTGASFPGDGLSAVACSATTCYAVGQYVDAAGNVHGLIVSTDGGSPTETTLTSAGFGAISCTLSGSCVVSSLSGATAETNATPDGSWAPLTGAGAGADYTCAQAGPCYGIDLTDGAFGYSSTAGAVYATSGTDAAQVGVVALPANCDASGSSCFDNVTQSVVGCGQTTCTEIDQYLDTNGDYPLSAAQFATVSSPPVVNSTGDAGAENGGANGCNTGQTVTVNGVAGPECTLRAAIQAENAGTVSQTTISFALPSSAGSTITPSSALPALTATGVTIAGTGITLNGSGAAGVTGLELSGAKDTVSGLTLTNWATGVKVDSAAGGDVVSGAQISGPVAAATVTIGVDDEGSPQAVIGGTTTATGDTIDGVSIGVSINGSAASGATVQSDQIGTSRGVGDGVFDVDASSVTIGGQTASPGAAPGNVIDAGGAVAGSTTDGVVIGGDVSTVTGAVVQGNRIGGGSQSGVVVAGSARGTVVSANLISGPVRSDIAVDGTSVSATQVLANTVGIDNIAAAQVGVDVGGASNTTIGSRNVITGATVAGVEVVPTTTKVTVVATGDVLPGTTTTQTSSTATTISSNVIGPLTDGASLPEYPQKTGVMLGGIGDTLGPGNEIAGNLLGVEVSGTREAVLGNLIGVDATGLRALPNGFGVIVDGKQAQIGAPGARPNTISGNLSTGVTVASTATATSIQNNLIGTTNQGNSPVAAYLGKLSFGGESPGPGIAIASGVQGSTLIGGPSTGAGNVISGNSNAGITISSPAVVQTNRIGVAALSGSAVPNDGPGILLNVPSTVGADPNAVSQGGGNLVADNAHGGILVGPDARPTSLLSDLVFANHDYEIRLYGPTHVDDLPPTVGAVLDASGHGTRVQVDANKLTVGSRVQVFRANDGCSTGETGTTDLLATARVTRAPDGVASVILPIRTLAVGTPVTAIVTRGAASSASSSAPSSCARVGGAAKIESATTDGSTETVTLDCTSPHPCADVVIEETIPAAQSSSLQSQARRRNAKAAHATVIARIVVRLRAHHKRTIRLRLNRTGRRRLARARRHRLTAQMTITEGGVTVRAKRVRLTRARPRAHR